MKTETVKIDQLTLDPENVRKHDQRNVEAIKTSLEKFGMQKPIVVDENNVVIAGNGTLKAAKLLGWEEIDVVKTSLAGLDKKAFGIADNKTTDLSDFDFNELAETLRGMQAEDYDLESMGFQDWELGPLLEQEYVPPEEQMLGEMESDSEHAPPPPEDEPIPEPDVPVVSAVGDAWALENHKILIGDVFSRLKDIPDESVQCVVTSPPYWGLRDYGTATWEGGEEGCDHEDPRSRGDDIKSGDKQATSAGSRPNTQMACKKCGAKRKDAQLGLEPTPEEHCANMVRVFQEVKRVLRKDGVCWVNYGDSYAQSGSGSGETNDKKKKNLDSDFRGGTYVCQKNPTTAVSGLKPKDLVGMPWRVAFALQADGWYLRSDVIWHKPNPMPESVTDRPTKAHEYVFLLSKSPKYYYDADAVRESYEGSTRPRDRASNFKKVGSIDDAFSRHDRGADVILANPAGRNLRDVWTIATQAMPEAHFATYPVKLVTPCIKAGTKENDVVLDPFGGAGTTMIVADSLGRACISTELNPKYADIAIRRWQKATGKHATLDGKTFEDVENEKTLELS